MNACDELNIIGMGNRDSMKLHGLSTTVITDQFQMNHDALSVSLRSGHAQLEIARAYFNVKGVLGKRQQHDILPDSGEKAKSHKAQECKQL